MIKFIKQNFNLILASQSQIRKKILQEAGFQFSVVKPDFDEDKEKQLVSLEPKDLALYLAKNKALSISKNNPNHYVIGSDQVCEFLGKEVFKSINLQDAITQLSSFNGSTHYQNNAIIIAKNNKVLFTNSARAKLTMRNLSKNEIKSYVEFDQSWGCAGSYKYESMGKHLFLDVEGDYFGILGLPIQPILKFFYREGLLEFKN